MKKQTPSTLGEEIQKLESASFLKIVPVKNIVLFPHNVMPLTSGKDWLQKSLDKNIQPDGTIGILSYRPKITKIINPISDLFTIGTEAKVLKVLKLPDGTSGAIIQGIRRFRVVEYEQLEHDDLSAHVEFLPDIDEKELHKNLEYAGLGKAVKLLVQKAIRLSPQVPNEVALFIENINDPLYLSDVVLPYLTLDFLKRQTVLEIEIQLHDSKMYIICLPVKSKF